MEEIKKPKWLRKLEEESWQAELVVSGVAIFGSLQLPGFLDNMAESSFGWFSSQANFVMYSFFLYSYVMAYILIVSFMVHFILRAFWIGMVGLNSAFPKGINSEKSNYPKYFVERYKKEYAYDQSAIQRLDDLCSIIFAGCAYFVLVFAVIDIDLFIGFGFWQLLCLFMPPELATNIILFIVSVFMFFSLVAIFLNLKFMRGTAISKRLHYPAFILGNRVMLHVFFRPAYHLRFVFMTNISLKKYFIWTLSFMVLVMVFGIKDLINSNAIFYSKNNILEIKYNRNDRLLSENYENLRQPQQGRIFSTVIESDHISGPDMRVFVPVFRNEKSIQIEVCGKFKKPENMDRDEIRILKRAYTSECLKKYHRFYINDSLYVPEIKKITHENKGEDGILTYIPTQNFKEGMNILKVEKRSTDTIYRTMQVPFYFSRELR